MRATSGSPRRFAVLCSCCAQGGFIRVSGNLATVGAEGHVLSLLHPLTGNPQEQSDEYFYAVVSRSESLAEKFAERLNLASLFPVKTE